MRAVRNFITPSYEGNIPKFFIYQVAANFMLFLPVWMIYLKEDHGLSLTTSTLLNSAFWLTMVFTEIPTGAVADTIGRKHSQIIGLVLMVGSMVLFGLARNYPLLVLSNSLWAFSITFVSGADMAFFYDTLAVLGRADDYPKFRGWLSAVVMAAVALSSILGGYLGEYSLRATFICTAAMTAVGLIFVLWFKEPPQEMDPGFGEKLSFRETLKKAFGAIRENVGLRYGLAYSSVYLLVPAAIRVTFIQPHTVGIGLPIATLGIISFGMRLFQVFGSTFADQTNHRIGEWRLLWVTPLVVTAGVLAMAGIQSWMGIALFGVTGFLTSAASPTVENLINRQTPSAVRATILSFDSLLFRLLTAILEPGVGVVGDAHGLPTAFVWISILFGLLTILILMGWRKVRAVSTQAGLV